MSLDLELYERLLNIIKAHGHPAQAVAGREYIRAYEVFTVRDHTTGMSVSYGEWVLVEASMQSVRNWLGY